MKQIPNSFTWYDRPNWYWPSHDEKLKQVNDWVRDADIAFKHIKRFDVAVQAGGACGVWPAYLAKHFKYVVTFEPVDTNYECLVKNVEGLPNVKHFKAALAEKKKGLSMSLDEFEKNNCGAHYAKDGGRTPAIPIDQLNLKRCDFIALDVEGYEYQALLGAMTTIGKFKPVIMIEEKPLPHMAPDQHLKARRHLESIGYKEVDKIHRDVVFVYV
ncbi:MAG: FkbM family methyltransferase [Rickettsiales bacterium]